MDRSYASQLQAFFKATLLGFVLFSMVTWVPHVCSCLMTFLFVSIPSTASAIITPKCLFVFSNIIVIFLASESKLSQGGAQSPSGGNIDVVGHQLAVLAPVMKEREENHAAEGTVKEEEEDSMVIAHESLQQVDDQCEQEDASSTTFGIEELREEESDVLLVNVGDVFNMKVQELARVEPLEDVIVKEECEEEMGLPTDVLNRRVEDFIARFNMERQQEARMLVYCC